MARKKYFTIEVSDELAKSFSKIPVTRRLKLLEETASMTRRELGTFCKKNGITMDMVDFWRRQIVALEYMHNERGW